MNLLLNALPERDNAEIAGHLEPCHMDEGQVLFEMGAKMDRIYFPDSGIVSLVSVFGDGMTAEITTVGREGMVNVGSLLDDDLAIARYNVQMTGDARCIAAHTLREIFHESPPVRQLFNRYIQALIAQISQGVACNGLHGVEERMARWLLTIHDRSNGDELLVTQEFMAQMLGVRRPTVTLVARTFQTAGLIRYRRGRITVLDRAGLVETACECHTIVENHFRRLVPEIVPNFGA